MTTATATISLRDYDKSVDGIGYLWFVSTAQPTGCEFHDNIESDDDYCVLSEIVDQFDFWDLEGHVINGRWEWNGEGRPTDHMMNSILNVKAI